VTTVKVWRGAGEIQDGDVYESKDVTITVQAAAALGWILQWGTIRDPGVKKGVQIVRFQKDSIGRVS